jgi:hypothetical protein
VSWTLCNLLAPLGVVSSLWFREITHTSKVGSTVTDVADARPLSYVDDLEGLFDAVWLLRTKQLLEDYSGSVQAGGKYDAMFVILTLLIVMQIRANLSMHTFLEVADLLHGYDLAWRDGVRFNLRLAGVRGRLWLIADASLNTDNFRVRMGNLVSTLYSLRNVGIGQGRRSGVHQFGALTKQLTDSCSLAAYGVAVNPPTCAISAWEATRHLAEEPAVVPGVAIVENTACELQAGADDQQRWLEVFASLPNNSYKLLLMDVISVQTFLMFQFIDDSLVLQSTAEGLAAVNKAMSKFCSRWRHAYGGGRKRPRVLTVLGPPVDPSQCGEIDGHTPMAVETTTALGVVFDKDLLWEPQFRQRLAKMSQASCRLVDSLDASGFGLPFQASQFISRVDSVGLFGSEVLASHCQGLKAVVKRFNDAQYLYLKRALGATTKMHVGSHVKVLMECRQPYRLGSRFLERIILVRARIQLLPTDHPLAVAVSVAERLKAVTWWTHTNEAKKLLGIDKDIKEYGGLVAGTYLDPIGRKAAVSKFKNEVVRPRLQAMEQQWFQESLAKLGAGMELTYQNVRPKKVWNNALCWSGWGRTMWRFHKAWCIARVTEKLPIAWFGGSGLDSVLPCCPQCRAADADLHHVLCVCSGTSHLRAGWHNFPKEAIYTWVLNDTECVDSLYAQVKYFGQCMATTVSYRQ